MWKLLKENGNWEKDEYQGKSSQANKGETGDFYLGMEMDKKKGYAEGHR